VPIEDGRNTRQILNYGYRYWHQLFNERQLLALTTLARAIAALPASPSREALALLFSGVLEFNNMFASYKGEGTGAVRHMFSHHILKPERMPIEANLWGTPQSSGSFSTLYRSRLVRAVGYRERPFEITLDTSKGGRPKAEKAYGLSPPMGRSIHSRFPKDGLPHGGVYLSCASSAKTDLPNGSVDLVVTDPPFFDNVHYSELADFFYVWQEEYFSTNKRKSGTTRNEQEVQDTDPDAFSDKLRAVFAECHRVLRHGGRMVFSYHHSREDGWSSIARAVLGAGFSLTQAQPVKSEMSVAAPKNQAKEPIDLDIMMVCKKLVDDARPMVPDEAAFSQAEAIARDKVRRFNRTERRLSRNDVRVVFFSQLLVELSAGRDGAAVEQALSNCWGEAKAVTETIWGGQQIFDEQPEEEVGEAMAPQLRLF
jgi:putative DNA methylase